MKYRMGIVAVLAIAIAIPLVAYGRQRQGGPGGRGFGGPGGPLGIMPMVHQLDLTDAQREQLRALMGDARKGGDPGQQARAAEQKLHAAILADPPDLQAIEGLKAALNTAHASELDRRIEMMQKVAQILTPAQRQQALKLESERPQRGRGPDRH
jgi:Spy/CpxP family protein refolding chaperone